MIKLTDLITEGNTFGDIKLKTLSQLKKSDRLSSTFYILGMFEDGSYTASYNRKRIISYARYILQSGAVGDDNYDEFITKFEKKIIKLSKSPKLKDLAIQRMIDSIYGNENNREIPKSAKDWIIGIVSKAYLGSISSFDGWKLYNYVTVDTDVKLWTSYQGASMTTKTAKITFSWDKDYTKEFEYDTSGYWNS